jgi:NADPH-dependent curcumin reductase CurA
LSINRQIVLNSRPQGDPVPGNFRLAEAAMPTPGPGELLVRNRYLAMEPATRGWLDDNDKNYFEPLRIGQAVRSIAMGEVIASNNPEYTVGNIVRGLLAWEEYSIATDDTILLEKIALTPGVPPSYYLGALGGSGETAYVGLHRIGRIQPGETVVISAATGGVGHVAGQVARLHGCRTVGLVGSAEKARIATDELGYDATINYREKPDLVAALRETCPEGVDVYFDNVGGATLDAMLLSMKMMGRIVCCGMIASYNKPDDPPPIFNIWQMVARQIEMKGFLLYSYAEHIPDALRTLESWVRSGELRVLENKHVGLERTPELFCDLLAGRTTGKSLIELEPA